MYKAADGGSSVDRISNGFSSAEVVAAVPPWMAFAASHGCHLGCCRNRLHHRVNNPRGRRAPGEDKKGGHGCLGPR